METSLISTHAPNNVSIAQSIVQKALTVDLNDFSSESVSKAKLNLIVVDSGDTTEKASGKRPETVAILTDNTAASLSTVKALKEGLLEKMNETHVKVPVISFGIAEPEVLNTVSPELLNGVPVTVFPEDQAVAEAIWPTNK